TGVTEKGNTVMDKAHGAQPIQHNGSLQLEPFVEATMGDYAFDPVVGDYAPVPAGTGSYTMGTLHDSADLVITYDGTDWSAADTVGTDVTAALASAVKEITTFNGYANDGSGNVEPTLAI